MRKRLFLLVCLSLVSFVSISSAQNTQTKVQTKSQAKENYNLVKEGKGIEGVSVGRSTMEDVIKKFGKGYRWQINKKYSYQMTYVRIGLAFYMCQEDKRKEIFLIEIKSPY